jgi:hypothetical protein
VKLSASIMAHPDRAEHVEALLSALDRPVPVSWDDEGKPSGNSDRVWRNARRGWELADPAADFHVLIQDDAMPCADLLAGLERGLEFVPADATLSLYLGTSRTVPIRWESMARAADSAGAAWVRSDRVLWGVALCLPVRLIPEMIGWADRKTGMPDDMRVGAWTEQRRGEVWYTWPSLVDHLPVPSLTKHRASDRRARRHHDGSALDITWSGPVVTDPMAARRNATRSGPTRSRPVRSVRAARGTRKAGNGA